MTAGPVKCPVPFPLQGAARYLAPRKAQRREKMLLRCCRYEQREPFYSSVPVPQLIAGNGKKSCSPRWGRRCGYKSPKYRLVPLGDQIVRVEVQGLHRPLPSFVIAGYTHTRQFYIGNFLQRESLANSWTFLLAASCPSTL
jgi:hypothetical protein